MRHISRRGFISTSSAALGALPLIRSVDAFAEAIDPVFRHGVASGDPLTDRVILWTRVTPPAGVTSPQNVSWELARDEKFTRIVTRGEVQTGAARDFTVKVDAFGLEPATFYYYRFHAGKAASPTGRTRTLPASDINRVRLGVVSCSNLPFGYFNAYACLAKRDLDAVLHLGDYFYEYENGRYGDGTALGRIPAPNKKLITLADYRGRHAQYKADPDSQDIHSKHPFIVVWDDHEFANDAWSGGAQNHIPATDGDWWARRKAAAQAYLEWMPIREDVQDLNSRIYRSFRFGNLVTLCMLDTRLIGRDQQVLADDIAGLESPARSVMGATQESWLADELSVSVKSNATWNVLGQQILFAPQVAPHTRAINADTWDGYRASRDRVYDIIERHKVSNIAVLTGDIHSSWAHDLPRNPWDGYDKSTGKGSLGVEFAGTSVTSPSGLGSGPDAEKRLLAARQRPHLHYVDGSYRGYFVIDLTRQRLQADYYAVDTILDRSTKEHFEKGFVTESGRNHLVEVSTPA